jgi:hypothetical protein
MSPDPERGSAARSEDQGTVDSAKGGPVKPLLSIARSEGMTASRDHVRHMRLRVESAALSQARQKGGMEPHSDRKKRREHIPIGRLGVSLPGERLAAALHLHLPSGSRAASDGQAIDDPRGGERGGRCWSLDFLIVSGRRSLFCRSALPNSVPGRKGILIWVIWFRRKSVRTLPCDRE